MKLMELVRRRLRELRYSRRTEEAYIQWIRRFIEFHDRRHPIEIGAPEVVEFLSWLAVEQKVAQSTQKQAQSALIFYMTGCSSARCPRSRASRRRAEAGRFRRCFPCERFERSSVSWRRCRGCVPA